MRTEIVNTNAMFGSIRKSTPKPIAVEKEEEKVVEVEVTPEVVEAAPVKKVVKKAPAKKPAAKKTAEVTE